jgi:hypothetical protein
MRTANSHTQQNVQHSSRRRSWIQSRSGKSTGCRPEVRWLGYGTMFRISASAKARHWSFSRSGRPRQAVRASSMLCRPPQVFSDPVRQIVAHAVDFQRIASKRLASRFRSLPCPPGSCVSCAVPSPRFLCGTALLGRARPACMPAPPSQAAHNHLRVQHKNRPTRLSQDSCRASTVFDLAPRPRGEPRE